MKPNKSLNLLLTVVLFLSQTTLQASLLPNSQILQSNLNSVSISKQTLSNLANTNPNPQLNLASINSGANININANELINTANINSGNDINIISNSFINQTLFTNDKANLNANNIFINAMANISNLGGDIVAKDNLVLNANDDIINSTNLNYYANDYKHTYSTTTNANLNTNNILINANNFTNISANINANDNLQIKAKNDINSNYLQGITTTYQGDASNYTKTENNNAILSDIKANNINLIAGNDINLAGLNIKAKENLNILANNDINILAAKNSSYKESGSYKSGFFSSKEEITINQSNTHTNSKLNANNINLASNSDINLFGVDLVANANNNQANLNNDNTNLNSQLQNSNNNLNSNNINLSSNINLRAGGDITQASVKDTNYYYHRVTKSSLFGLNQGLHEKEAYNEKALISQAIANDGSLTYDAKDNLLLQGVQTYSNKDTNLNADSINITSLELNSFSNEVNKKSKFNLGGFLFETGLKIPLAFSGVILPTDSTEIYKSELHKSNIIKTTNQSSTISSNTNVNINSNNDITIKGSNLNANNNINLSSQSANINIISSQDITQTKTLDEVKRIEIGGANDFIKTLIDDIKNTSIQGHSTVAKIEKSNDDTTKTTITNNSSNLNADNININSNLDTNIKASNLNANDSINIASTGGDINILSDKNLNQSQSNSNLKERIHFVDYKSDNTNLKETNVKSNIVSNNINLNANEITLKASNIIANESIQIDTTRLNLISDKDNHTSISNSNNKDTLIAEVKSQGKITEIEIPAIIEVGDKFILNGKDISDKLDTKIYQTISNSLNDETIKNSIIKQISSNSNIPLDDITINQIQVALNSDEWDKSTKRL